MLGALAASLTAAPPPRPRITVLLYNYAAISAETIANAKHEADLIYARMEVEIEWADYPMFPHEAAANRIPPAGLDRLEIRLLPHSMSDRLKPGRDEVGRALIADEGVFGEVADIFTDRLMGMTSTWKWAAGPLLGGVMAHEIGHLLLGPGSHSKGGIMRTRWGEKDLDRALQRHMLFTSREAEQIRKQVLARMGSGLGPAANEALEPEREFSNDTLHAIQPSQYN